MLAHNNTSESSQLEWELCSKGFDIETMRMGRELVWIKNFNLFFSFVLVWIGSLVSLFLIFSDSGIWRNFVQLRHLDVGWPNEPNHIHSVQWIIFIGEMFFTRIRIRNKMNICPIHCLAFVRCARSKWKQWIYSQPNQTKLKWMYTRFTEGLKMRLALVQRQASCRTTAIK